MERVKKITKIIILGSYGSAFLLPIMFVILIIVLSFPIVFTEGIITGSKSLYDIISYAFLNYTYMLKMLLKYYIVLVFFLFFVNIYVLCIIYDIIKIFIMFFE